jgi:hypothetical protein
MHVKCGFKTHFKRKNYRSCLWIEPVFQSSYPHRELTQIVRDKATIQTQLIYLIIIH